MGSPAVPRDRSTRRAGAPRCSSRLRPGSGWRWSSPVASARPASMLRPT